MPCLACIISEQVGHDLRPLPDRSNEWLGHNTRLFADSIEVWLTGHKENVVRFREFSEKTIHVASELQRLK
jgi:hypothetical protein